MEDAAIVALFFARSEQAIGELDGKYGAVCHKLSYNILGSWQDAEECVNDAYWGVWKAVPPVRPNPLLAYVCKIVRNVSCKRYHANTAAKRDSRYRVAMEELSEILAAPDDAESTLEARELTRLLSQFLDALDAENRVIFLRRYWFSDSYQEIAAQVGLREKTVSVRLSRMRQKLRQFLSKQGVIA